MKVWLITVGEPLPVGGQQSRLWRTGLVANALIERAHEVLWWTSAVDHFTKRYHERPTSRLKLSDRLELEYLDGRLYRKNVSVDRLINHHQIAANFGRIAQDEAEPDVILCSFPTIELSLAAAEYGMHHGVPVVLDIRDLWPDEIRERIPAAARPLVNPLLWPMERAARKALRLATGITAISERYLGWGLARAGREKRPADRVFPMGYPKGRAETPGDDVGARLQQLGVDRDKKIFWFAGTFVGNIDLDTVIEAAGLLKAKPSVQVVISGSGENEAALRSKARGLPNVAFTGWVNAREIAWLASVAWAGLASYRTGALMSLPNKLFEYMSFGLPVLISLGGEAQDLVQAHGIGRAYRAGDPRDLARVMEECVADQDGRAVQAQRASALYESRFSSERIYPELVQHLERIASTGEGEPEVRSLASGLPNVVPDRRR